MIVRVSLSIKEQNLIFLIQNVNIYVFIKKHKNEKNNIKTKKYIYVYFIISIEHLKKLTSYYKYSKFEDGENGCNGISFYSNIKEELQNQNYQIYNLHIISDKILKALCFIYNRKRNYRGNFDEELCWYLYYWLGDIIYTKVQNQRVFSNIIQMIYTELYSNPENLTVCRHVHTPLNKDRFNKNKVLFDYSKDYHNIEMATPHGQTTCDKKYKEYMKTYISMYNQAYLDCKEGKGNNFDCDYFSKLFQEKPYQKLSSFSCIQRDDIEVVLDKQKAIEQHQTVPVQSYRQTRDKSPLPHHIPARNADLGMKQLSDHKFPRTIETIQMYDTTEGGTSKTIAGSVAPVLGVSSISLLLYKVI
ncbi:hypothetical protein PVBG_05633 [Plasmodium vivax Brazil I]|uniref:Variable surface protein Vir7-like protein n=1 Tax=Plasmodium vivax (strain Brazil I) TaxID=1033975 RepID=A0A0J9T2N0_PLAV1|nr:hypothetical protein PVBG_05633 [Plasmodium vivax Brazil I]